MAEEVYADKGYDENDQAKDHWIATGRDSLFKNAMNAIKTVEQGYDIPTPPPPPSIEVTSLPEVIVVEWGDESEAASDLAGYRVYRVVGSPYIEFSGSNELLGQWELIQEFGPGVNIFEDEEAERGVAYYYYVAAFDADGLESGKWMNHSRHKAAHLTNPPAEELYDVRVVPNPYNIKSPNLYPGEEDKIMFLELPPVCTIRIFTESGNLIRTIKHTDGSGDEAWADPTGEHFMTTSSSQQPVSGLYIAQIETPDGRSVIRKILIVR